METTVRPASPSDESVLRNLAQLYAYDFAEIMGWNIPGSGRFPDAIVDGCFDGGRRHPFLLHAAGALAGFAIVDTRSRLSGDQAIRDMAEFFVARTVARRQPHPRSARPRSRARGHSLDRRPAHPARVP